MRSKLIIALLLLCLGASAQKYPKTGSKEIKEVVICDTLILNILKNEIIPELISLDRNSSEYDIYLNVTETRIKNYYPSNYELSISAEETRNIPVCINDSDFCFTFTQINGYTIFIRQEFGIYYTKPKEPKSHRLFDFDNRRKRPSIGNNATWKYFIIGGLKNPNQLLFKSKIHYAISSEYKRYLINETSEFWN